MARTGTILLAAGSSSRAGAHPPKQFQELGAEPMFIVALRAVLSSSDEIVIAVPAGEVERARKLLKAAGLPDSREFRDTAIRVLEGGARRQDSVALALGALSEAAEIVLIHDAARPFASPAVVERVLRAAAVFGAAIPAVPVPDTVKRVEGDRVLATLDRSLLRMAQTPQGFRRSVIEKAYILLGETDITDDAQAVELAGCEVVLVEGDPANIKVTTAADLELARARLLPGQAEIADMIRMGFGTDSHRLVPDRPLILGGIGVPFEKGLAGHSDADVLTHSICDALLGAVAAGDIGQHFPADDPAYRGVSSLILLEKVRGIVDEKGYGVVNIDATIIAQAPKLSPYIPGMRKMLSEVLRSGVDDVSIKATTTEGAGPEGEGTSISATAVAVVVKRY